MKHYFLGKEFSDTIVNKPNAKRVYSDFELSIMQGVYDSLDKFFPNVTYEFRLQYENFSRMPWELWASDFMDFLAGSIPVDESEFDTLIRYLQSLDM